MFFWRGWGRVFDLLLVLHRRSVEKLLSLPIRSSASISYRLVCRAHAKKRWRLLAAQGRQRGFMVHVAVAREWASHPYGRKPARSNNTYEQRVFFRQKGGRHVLFQYCEASCGREAQYPSLLLPTDTWWAAPDMSAYPLPWLFYCQEVGWRWWRGGLLRALVVCGCRCCYGVGDVFRIVWLFCLPDEEACVFLRASKGIASSSLGFNWTEH